MYEKEDDLRRIRQRKFFSCAIYNHSLYGISEFEHILIKIDLQSGEVKYIDDPKNYDYITWHLEDKMEYRGEEIFALQLGGKRLLQYSMKDDRCKYFDIDCDFYDYGNFAAFLIYKEIAYIFPSFINQVIFVDILTGEITRGERLCSDVMLKPKQNVEYSDRLFSAGCQIENTVWLFMQNSNRVLEYNLDLHSVIEHQIPHSIMGCKHVSWKNGLFYILDIHGDVYQWDSNQNILIEIFDNEEKGNLFKFEKVVAAGKKVWILPSLGEDIFVFDKDKEEVEKYIDYPKDFKYEMPDDRGKYVSYCEDDSYYYFSLSSGNFILSIGKENGKETWILPKWPSEDKRQEILFKRNYPIVPEELYGLSGYLALMKSKNIEKIVNKGIKTGKEFWEKIKNGK